MSLRLPLLVLALLAGLPSPGCSKPTRLEGQGSAAAEPAPAARAAPAAPTATGPTTCLSVRDQCRPTLDLVDLYGAAHPARALDGKVVVVNFWATWCGPCLTEIPELSALSSRLRSQGVEFLGVLSGDDAPAQDVLALAADLGMSYPTVLADAATDTAFDDPTQLPTTFVFDRQGALRLMHTGSITEAELAAVLEPLAVAP